MYALPWSMSVSAFYNVREGLQFNRTILSPTRTGAGGTVNVLIEPQGTLHYPVHKQLDINLDKTVSFGRRRDHVQRHGVQRAQRIDRAGTGNAAGFCPRELRDFDPGAANRAGWREGELLRTLPVPDRSLTTCRESSGMLAA